MQDFILLLQTRPPKTRESHSPSWVSNFLFFSFFFSCFFVKVNKSMLKVAEGQIEPRCTFPSGLEGV